MPGDKLVSPGLPAWPDNIKLELLKISRKKTDHTLTSWRLSSDAYATGQSPHYQQLQLTLEKSRKILPHMATSSGS